MSLREAEQLKESWSATLSKRLSAKFITLCKHEKTAKIKKFLFWTCTLLEHICSFTLLCTSGANKKKPLKKNSLRISVGVSPRLLWPLSLSCIGPPKTGSRQEGVKINKKFQKFYFFLLFESKIQFFKSRHFSTRKKTCELKNRKKRFSLSEKLNFCTILRFKIFYAFLNRNFKISQVDHLAAISATYAFLYTTWWKLHYTKKYLIFLFKSQESCRFFIIYA